MYLYLFIKMCVLIFLFAFNTYSNFSYNKIIIIFNASNFSAI